MKIDWTKVRVNPAECDTELGLYFVSGCGLRSTRPSVGSVSHPPEALDMVETGRTKAQEVDTRAVFYSFGTVRMANTFTGKGVLNQFFDLPS